jgi:uncharacterized membrane protein YkvA (DUF1232 family)
MQTIDSLAEVIAAVRRNIGAFKMLVTRFTSAPRSVQVMIVVALLYAASPLDVIPDLLPGVGVIDDITVMAVLFMLAWRRFVAHVDEREAPPQDFEVHSDTNDAPIEATVRDANATDGQASRTYVRRRPSTAG